MKLVVTKCFYDKQNNNKYRNVGEIIEIPEARANEIENRGYGKILEEKKPIKASSKEEPKKEKTIDEPKKVKRK